MCDCGLTIYPDIPWVALEKQSLTLDVIAPENITETLPVLVIYHGGGWLVNDNTIMESAAQYLADHGRFVVANINYRLLVDQDNSITLNQIIEDAMGALLWVKTHIAAYGGDPHRIGITGDSAGGHLASMILLSGRNLSSQGFSAKPLGFRPTYIPPGKTLQQLKDENVLEVRAAVISYGVLDVLRIAEAGFESSTNGFWEWAGVEARGLLGNTVTVEENPEYYRAVSPIHLIPHTNSYRLPPQFHLVGSRDKVTAPATVEAFVKKLEAAGQPVEYKLYPGKNHAFLDSGINPNLGNSFEDDAPTVLADMIVFFKRYLGE